MGTIILQTDGFELCGGGSEEDYWESLGAIDDCDAKDKAPVKNELVVWKPTPSITQPGHDPLFAIFSDLPAEVREKIWLSVLDPVELEGKFWWEYSDWNARMILFQQTWERRRWADVVLYCVNQESRALAIMHYGMPTRHSIPFHPMADSFLINIEDHDYCGSEIDDINWVKGWLRGIERCKHCFRTGGQRNFSAADGDHLRLGGRTEVGFGGSSQTKMMVLIRWLTIFCPHIECLRFDAEKLNDEILSTHQKYNRQTQNAFSWVWLAIMDALADLTEPKPVVDDSDLVPFKHLRSMVVGRNTGRLKSLAKHRHEYKVARDPSEDFQPAKIPRPIHTTDSWRVLRSEDTRAQANSLVWCQKDLTPSVETMVLEQDGFADPGAPGNETYSEFGERRIHGLET
ncbi:hypothetical protein B0H67DRAFT_681438 [Lasiosphaeris hirsuta]|uniref:2EXR domain-containing protein n=1 Tax=Lasiosphaeris hirsuta TaxID=260670 RepID=A0AA40ANV6_9PEZI|nr:hypothetical protein B0H67DRAFT_681438 [Lasiosphaeris hirsuta]